MYIKHRLNQAANYLITTFHWWNIWYTVPTHCLMYLPIRHRLVNWYHLVLAFNSLAQEGENHVNIHISIWTIPALCWIRFLATLIWSWLSKYDMHLSNMIYLYIISLLINKIRNIGSFTSPKCESPRGPLVSVCAMMTFTPGRIFNRKQMFKTEVNRSWIHQKKGTLIMQSHRSQSMQIFPFYSLLHGYQSVLPSKLINHLNSKQLFCSLYLATELIFHTWKMPCVKACDFFSYSNIYYLFLHFTIFASLLSAVHVMLSLVPLLDILWLAKHIQPDIAQTLYWEKQFTIQIGIVRKKDCSQSLTFPDSISGRLWGEPLSTKRTLRK